MALPWEASRPWGEGAAQGAGGGESADRGRALIRRRAARGVYHGAAAPPPRPAGRSCKYIRPGRGAGRGRGPGGDDSAAGAESPFGASRAARGAPLPPPLAASPGPRLRIRRRWLACMVAEASIWWRGQPKPWRGVPTAGHGDQKELVQGAIQRRRVVLLAFPSYRYGRWLEPRWCFQREAAADLQHVGAQPAGDLQPATHRAHRSKSG